MGFHDEVPFKVGLNPGRAGFINLVLSSLGDTPWVLAFRRWNELAADCEN
jgi:hypothetical protein